ncbi:MAG TPA: glycosyltransferase [bacterium]|nr:glycosyltransferase [bacterium]
MRILFATSIRTWGGGEEWMLANARGLANRGHEVSLTAPAGSAVLQRSRAAGLRCFQAPFRADLDLQSFARVHRHCMHHRIQAMVLNMDRVLRVGGTAARLAGVPVVLPRRGSEFPLKDGLLYRWTYRRIATGMLVNSQATARTLVRNLAWRPAGRVHVLPNGLDPARFDGARSRDSVRDDLAIDPHARVVLAVGELTARKNAALLVDAAPAIAAAVPNLCILIAGAGAEEERLRRRIRDNGMEARIRLLGFRDDVPDLLAAADLLVHPARVEGFGYAVAEAMAAGLPVVATNASSLPELVDDGVTGVLFPPEDRGALEGAVIDYLNDPEKAAAHGAAGRARAHREFRLDRRLSELEELLEREIADAEGAPGSD